MGHTGADAQRGFVGWDLCKIPIFGIFLRNALLERLKIFQYCLRVLRCYCFELCSKLRFCKGLTLRKPRLRCKIRGKARREDNVSQTGK